MTYARRFAFALAVTFALSLTNARAQTPSVSTVNVTPDEQKVRIAATRYRPEEWLSCSAPPTRTTGAADQ